MKVDIIFSDYITNGKVRMIDSIELKSINNWDKHDTRILFDEFEIDKRTDMRVQCSDDNHYLIGEVDDITNKNRTQITNELLEQFAEGINEGWLDAKELGGLFK